MYLVLGKLVQKEEDFVEHQLPAISESNSSDEWDSVDEEIKQVEDEAVRSELAREPSAEIPPSVQLIPLSPLAHQSEPNIVNPNNTSHDFDLFFRRF